MARLSITPGILGRRSSGAPTIGRSTATRWDEERDAESGAIPWQQYKAMVDWSYKERGLQQDQAQFQIQEARRVKEAEFDKILRLKEAQLKEENIVFDDLMGAIKDASGNLPLQENLLALGQQVVSDMSGDRRRIFQAQLNAGPAVRVKQAQYLNANPPPRHSVTMEEDPALWAREEFAILDYKAGYDSIRGINAPPATHIPLMRIEGKGDEKGFNMVAVRDPANPHKVDVLASGPMGGELPFGQYIAEGGIRKDSQVIAVNGRKMRITNIHDPLTGQTRTKKEELGIVDDPWKDHPMKKEVNSLKLDFATDGGDKDSPTHDLYKRLVDWIDKTRSQKDINTALMQELTPIDNLSIRVKKYKGADWWSKYLRIGDQLDHGEYGVIFIPGKFRWIDEEKKIGFFYNDVNNSYYDMQGRFLGTEEEVLEKLRNANL
jgi:hypothetical protein